MAEFLNYDHPIVLFTKKPFMQNYHKNVKNDSLQSGECFMMSDQKHTNNRTLSRRCSSTDFPALTCSV